MSSEVGCPPRSGMYRHEVWVPAVPSAGADHGRGAGARISVAVFLFAVFLFSAASSAVAQEMDDAYRFYREGDFERAAEVVESLVDRGQASPSDMAFLGTCYLNMGNVEKADEIIGAAAMLAPDAYPVMLARGNLALARSRYGEAEEIFRRARERFSSRREAQEGAALAAYGRAAELIEAGEYEQALPPLRRAAAAQPENERLLAALIAVLRKTGGREELLDAYERYLELHPYSADALAGRGLLLAEMGQTIRALGDLKKAADLDTSEPEVYYALALRSMERGELEEARTMLHETIGKAVQLYSMYRIQAAQAMEGSGAKQESPADGHAEIAVGRGKRTNGAGEASRTSGAGAATGHEAESAAVEGAAIDGAAVNGPGADGAGARLRKLKELSESARRPQKLLREALELLPETYQNRSLLLDDLRRLADWYPSSVDLRAALARELAGRGETAEAREIWRELTERFAFYYQGHLGAGRSYEQEGNYARALLCYRRALDLAGEEPEVYRHLRELYRRRDEMPAYRQLLKEQMLKDAYNPLLYEEAAAAEETAGDTAAADRYRQRAEELREAQ